MDIQVARFREVLALLKPVVLRNPTLESLKSILLKDGQAVATDLDTMVIVPMPEVDGTYLLPHADVSNLLQYTQGGEMLKVTGKRGKVTLSWSEGKSTLPTLEEDTFPPAPEFVPVVEASLDTDTLIPAMVSVLPYVATDQTRPVLAGVSVVFGNPMEVAAGDGFRMAHKALALSFPEDRVTIIPASSVSVLNLLWKKTPRTPPDSEALVPMLTAKKHAMAGFDGKRGLRFRFGDNTTAIVKLVEGEPPAWLKLVPKEEPVLQVNVFAAELELAVRRVAQVATSGSGVVRIVIDNTTAVISAKSEGKEVESTIAVHQTKGTEGKFGLDVNYLLDYLKGKDGFISISWTGGTAPVGFQHPQHPKVLIMPMNVEW